LLGRSTACPCLAFPFAWRRRFGCRRLFSLGLVKRAKRLCDVMELTNAPDYGKPWEDLTGVSVGHVG